MKVREGQKVRVLGGRGKGNYNAIATADFDTETDEWYPVAVDQDETVFGTSNEWGRGDSIPCRRGIDKIEQFIGKQIAEAEGLKLKDFECD